MFNMDEVGFELSFERRKRKVASRTHPRNGQALPAANQHITVIACIGVDSAPVPPVVIYPGASLQTTYTAVSELDVK